LLAVLFHRGAFLVGESPGRLVFGGAGRGGLVGVLHRRFSSWRVLACTARMVPRGGETPRSPVVVVVALCCAPPGHGGAACHANPSGSVKGPASLPMTIRCDPVPSGETPASLAAARRL